jgi:hypothetical protein
MNIKIPVDVWFENDPDFNDMIKSVGKSASDSFLNCNQLSGLGLWYEDEKDFSVLKNQCIKLKSQDMYLSYPCICSNIGENILI